ncbi:PP2C family protein-serine/threonine phosphatase [Pseudobacteriovorax antillogorgiicola]|uniref:Serine/threonine protein phosphatase PrpC n=1 Tax=Pseudobacteriovorax antillogorgiicola TaxID=1513793 RepID=A0A1Y6BHZ0_9BACT|nr:protein phosphatase 2C domain-containing protein [Pseudobacteriovorax antillogorgiicola]TCS56466.1 serine/threonine protein phosphatase PrpC [Pseudobacteriovorax antillogorgiicola]SMF05132.1 Serine/threonine protein phosphatase PrpC [Pseudobacteriovorax antillogorgiicola]
MTEDNQDLAQCLILGRFQVATRTRPAPGKAQNEDSLAAKEVPSGLVALIADGVGGCPRAHEASQAVATELADQADKQDFDLITFADRCQDRIRDMKVGAASTLACIQIVEHTLRYLIAGDSLVKVIGGRGKIKDESPGHSVLNMWESTGILDSIAPSRQVQAGYELLNCLGSDTCYYHISPMIPLAPKDIILIASDGIFDNLSSQELVQVISSSGPSALEICQGIFEALDRSIAQASDPKLDDSSLIVIRQT